MLHTIDDPSKIESNCYAPPLDAEGPTDERCKADATTYVTLSSGIRRYICEDHAVQIDRFGDLDLEDHPTVALCDACQRLAPKEKVGFDGRCVDCEI